jgi:nitrite reductase/ring-hydroxylating ferredoxin subunit
MLIFINKDNLPKLGEYKYYDYPDLKNEILVYNSTKGYLVYSSFCPHFGGILAVKNEQLHCFFHDYKFDLHTGVCINRDLYSKCRKYESIVDENGLNIEIL